MGDDHIIIDLHAESFVFNSLMDADTREIIRVYVGFKEQASYKVPPPILSLKVEIS